MLTQVFSFPSVKQKHVDELVVEMGLRVFGQLKQLAKLLLEEFIVLEDQFALGKFVVSRDVIDRALAYAELTTKML